jgi:ubiquinol-cytochrome c reductase cytochrome b subunit
MGYSLVWGQMSFWAVTVITNLFSSLDSVIPGFGTMLVQWIWGGFSVGEPTLNRLFSLHYLFPFIIAGVVVLHVWALHIPGSNNPTGVDVKTSSDTLSFHPYFTIKDGFAAVMFFILFAGLVFYAPNYLGHSDNYIPADPLVTPAHIVPEWYFLPFYAILRAIPDKLMGVIAMFASIAVLFVIPWLDTSRIRSVSYRPIFKWFFWLFIISCIALGYLGAQVAEGWYVFFSRVFTAYYFAFFLLVMPIVGLIEKPKRLPGSITESVLGPQASSAPVAKPPKDSSVDAMPGGAVAAAAAEGRA